MQKLVNISFSFFLHCPAIYRLLLYGKSVRCQMFVYLTESNCHDGCQCYVGTRRRWVTLFYMSVMANNNKIMRCDAVMLMETIRLKSTRKSEFVSTVIALRIVYKSHQQSCCFLLMTALEPRLAVAELSACSMYRRASDVHKELKHVIANAEISLRTSLKRLLPFFPLSA